MLKKCLSAVVIAALVCAQAAECAAPRSRPNVVCRAWNSNAADHLVKGVVIVGSVAALAKAGQCLWIYKHKKQSTKGQRLAKLEDRFGSKGSHELPAGAKDLSGALASGACQCHRPPAEISSMGERIANLERTAQQASAMLKELNARAVADSKVAAEVRS